MKVYTKLIIDIGGNVVEEESFEYEGSIALAKGGGASAATQTVKQEVPQYIENANKDVINQSQQMYKGGSPMVAPINAQQQGGLQGVQGAAQQQAGRVNSPGGGIDQAYSGLSRYMDPGMLDINNNQYFNAAADAATRPIYQNLTQQALPQIRGGFQDQYGGSRQGIAEGLAIQGASQADADVRSKMAYDFYNTNAGLQAQMLQQAPTIMGQLGQVGAAPSQMQLESGMIQQQLESQQLLDPFNRLDWLRGQVPGGYGTSTTTTMPQPKQNQFASALGGGLAGFGVAGPWGAAAGGLAGLLGSR